MIFFDVQSACGDKDPANPEVLDLTELLKEYERLGIGGALVHMQPDGREVDFELSNTRLFNVCRPHSEVLPCPIVVPNSGLDLADEEGQVNSAIFESSGAVCIRPGRDSWSLDPWCCDRLFKVLEERRMPVYCPAATVSFTVLAELAGRYPRLPLIHAETGYRSQRLLLPLLQAYPSIYLSIGNNYCVHRGVEQLVKEIGAERLLFGTGFPVSETMAAITMLMYALISDSEKEAVAGANFTRLLEDIRK